MSDCDSDVPREAPVSPERVLPPPNGSTLLSAELERPLLRDADSLSELEADSEAESPTVLVYETPVVSVTEVPMVSVSWESTKRCSVPICSLAAFASSALPRRMNATAAFPLPIRCRTCGGIDR